MRFCIRARMLRIKQTSARKRTTPLSNGLCAPELIIQDELHDRGLWAQWSDLQTVIEELIRESKWFSSQVHRLYSNHSWLKDRLSLSSLGTQSLSSQRPYLERSGLIRKMISKCLGYRRSPWQTVHRILPIGVSGMGVLRDVFRHCYTILRSMKAIDMSIRLLQCLKELAAGRWLNKTSRH